MTVRELVQQYAAKEFENGDDTGVLTICNEPTEPGSISRRDVEVTLANFAAVDGLISFVLKKMAFPQFLPRIGGQTVDSSLELWGLYCLFQSVMRIAGSSSNIQLGVADVDAVLPRLQNLIEGGVIDGNFFATLKSKQTKIGKAQSNLGHVLTYEDVSSLREGQ